MRSEIIPKISECVEEISRSPDVRERFRGRARDIPSDIFSRGLAYALTYTAARSSARAVEKGLMITSCKDLVKGIADEEMSPEEKGYALYGALLLYILKEAGVLKATTFSEAVRSVLGNPMIEVYASSAAEWIKRLAEAYIEAEER